METKDYKIIKGKIPIILSAPHALKHYRNAIWKQADTNTDYIALQIQKKTNCHVIYRSVESMSDPNYDEFDVSEYKQAMLEYIKEQDIKLLIDLHGSKYERDYLIELGTCDDSDSSLKQRKWIAKMMIMMLEEMLKDKIDYFHKGITKNRVFKASSPNTITRSISLRSDCSCIQMEINSYLRCFDEKDCEYFIDVMIDVVNCLNKVLQYPK